MKIPGTSYHVYFKNDANNPSSNTVADRPLRTEPPLPGAPKPPKTVDDFRSRRTILGVTIARTHSNWESRVAPATTAPTGGALADVSPTHAEVTLASPAAANALSAKQLLKAKAADGGKQIDASIASMDAPVREIPQEQFAALIKQLRRDIQAWEKPTANFDGMPSDARNRISDALKILALASEPDEHNLGYFVGGRLDGVITLSQVGEHFEVSTIATHPGSTGAGGALMEQAATLAEQSGHQGRLKLVPLQGSIKAYEALGFKPTGVEDYMQLDPRTSPDVWALQDGKWRLRKHQTETYLTALRQSAPLENPPGRD